ncbi:MAG: histidine--tRNA ligase [Bacteroidales bacterium]
MAIQKPSIPKGTRDFSPVEMERRNHIFNTIRSVFALHGYQQIETPSMENLSTLLGKYGEEGDKLLFRILNSGDFLSKVDRSALQEGASPQLSAQLCEKGLRYDLTVPFARYVVQNQADIIFPFKRYQIQPVWRADRPQKGRYREFFQCDADVVGSNSLLNELELMQIIARVFDLLGIAVVVKINNRKVLAGIAEYIGQPDKVTDITVAIDKMEKIGLEKVREELLEKSIPPSAIEALQPVLTLSGSNREKLATLATLFEGQPTGTNGVEELTELFNLAEAANVEVPYDLDLTLARGLNYYTGAIFEVKARDVQIGSISGGGRYDNLTGIFGLPGLSGVGISFGADRIYDVLMQTNGFPPSVAESPRLLFLNFGGPDVALSLQYLREVRKTGIRAELYPDPVKIKKQMAYANARNIAFVAIQGEEEIEKGVISVKNMTTGQQKEILPGKLGELMVNGTFND